MENEKDLTESNSTTSEVKRTPFNVRLLKGKKNEIPKLFILFIFIIAGLFHYIFYHTELDLYKDSLESIDTQYKDSSWYMVDSAMQIANSAAKESGLKVSKILVQNIQAENDMELLKGKLDSGEWAESGFFSAIHSSIRGNWLLNIKNSQNDIFVIYKEDIVIDTSVNENGVIYENINQFIEKQYNPELAEEAVQNLMKNKTSDIIFIESKQPSDTSHQKLSTMSRSSLKSVLDNEGLEGIKNYEILIPTYITEDGDVFGTKDITFEGNASKNHKMILVQKYNLHDILSIYYSNQIKALNVDYTRVKNDTNDLIRFTNLSYLAIMLMDMIAILLVLFYASKAKKES